MFYTIYQITNLLDNKIYIGKHQTKDPNDSYMGSGKHIKSAIADYGIKNFKKEILFQFDNEADMNSKEAELVTEEFCLREDTYNLCPGGHGGWGYLNSVEGLNLQNRKSAIKDWNENARKIHSKKLKEDTAYRLNYVETMSIVLTKARSKIQINGMKDKKHSDETKKAIGAKNSNLQMGKNNSQYGTTWITDGSLNKKIKKEELIPEGWYKGRKTT